MSAQDLAAVLIAFVALGGAVALTFAATSLRRSASRLRLVADELEAETGRLLDQLDRLSVTTSSSLEMVDDLAERAIKLTTELEETSRMGYALVARPVIKAAGLASGMRVGARRLRARETEAVEEVR